MDEREDEEEEEEDLAWMHRRHRRAEGGGRPQGSDHGGNNRELNQNEGGQVRHSRNMIEEQDLFSWNYDERLFQDSTKSGRH